MTEERNSGHTPPAFTSFSAEANPRTIREGAAGASSTSDYYPTISDEAWAYPLNMLNSPSDAIYVTEHADMNENGSTAHRLPLISSDDIDANLSTSHASMEESSAIWEDDPRIPNGSWGGQRNTQYYPADVTSTMHDMAGKVSTGYWPPVSSSGGDDAVPSTSRAGMEGASASLENNGRIPNGSWGGQRNTQYYPADVTSTMHDMAGKVSTGYWPPVSSSGGDDAVPSTSRAGMEGASASLENNGSIPSGSWAGQLNTQCYPADVISTMYGHTDMAENGTTGYRPPVCSSGGDDAMPSTSRAGMEEASASLENNGRNATGTEENEQQELCGVCGVCSKVYTTLHTLHRHATEHYGDESYICEACHLPSVKMTKSVRHCQKSTGEKIYKCETCFKFFKIPSHLKIHQRTHTGMKPYNCETCGKSFAQSAHLNAHKRTHTGVTPYRCETCGKLFKMLSHLNVHQRMHTGVSPYRCKTCGKSFKQLSHLNVHERTHTGEKPHVCPKCMKSFQSKQSLKEHFNLHTGTKPFVCQICSKSFGNSSSLRSHRLRHMDESPNQCAHCGARFADRETLDGHMCERVTCYLCGDSFIDDIQLATHLVKHRDGQPKQ
ncbi:zinc finger protein 25-like isoform X2 [Dermacentor silvarum]|uniref:zinc finger protein 25-like isoform X2 n=1 Tax=Dermacentor silvarum TaxID=543639 RepID=UPI0021017906|nr:zinc finger protein 25-like isoform X2 [Dermacentor silvarum]